jgi:hypothetical protein
VPALQEAGEVLKLGFTGTRAGLTAAQAARLRELVAGATEVHHGDCVGADEQFHRIAIAAGVRVVIHPPTDPKQRAFCKGADAVLPPQPYLKRNQAIVRSTDYLVGCPKEATEPRPGRGQGTWSTIRFARRLGRRTEVVWPTGAREDG